MQKEATPLTELLKKETHFVWTERRQQVFEELNKALTTTLILSLLDWDQEFYVTIDASGWCLGAIFWQHQKDRREKPIYYACQRMSPAEWKYTTKEREALAVVYAYKKFRHYLLGYRFVFHTDHDSLKYLVNKLDIFGWIARWILLLQELNYEVVVKPGKANSNANFLSRQWGSEAVLDIVSHFSDEFLEESQVFHIFSGEASEFDDVIRYLTEKRYPNEMTQEKKMVFETTVAPYTLIRRTLADGTRRPAQALSREGWKEASHESTTLRSVGRSFCDSHYDQPNSVGKILLAIYQPRHKRFRREMWPMLAHRSAIIPKPLAVDTHHTVGAVQKMGDRLFGPHQSDECAEMEVHNTRHRLRVE